MEDKTEEKKEKKTTASQTSTGHKAYHIEVRSSVHRPVNLFGKYYGQEWTRWAPESTCLPVSRLHVIERYFNLYTYEEAMAMAWMAMAYSMSFATADCFGLAVRLVESKVNYSFEAIRERDLDRLPWRGPDNNNP